MKPGTDNFQKMSDEERRSATSKGGVLSGRSRRKKKLLKDIAKTLLYTKLPKDSAMERGIKKALAELGVKSEVEPTIAASLVVATIQCAIKNHSLQAVEMLCSMAGEPLPKKLDQTMAVSEVPPPVVLGLFPVDEAQTQNNAQTLQLTEQGSIE